MERMKVSRRDLLIRGGATLTGLALLDPILLARVLPGRKGEEVIPFLDQPPEATLWENETCSIGKRWIRGLRRTESFSASATTISL